MLCTLYKIGELHFRLLGTNDFHVKTCCRQNLKYIWELKQPRRRRQQKPHKFAYLTRKNSIFARFARAFFFFWHFEDILVLSTTWNDQFCSWVNDVSAWWQMFNFVFLCPKRRFQLNSRIVRTHFSSIMSLNNWKMIAETRSYIFRLRSSFRRRRVCLSSLTTISRRRLADYDKTLHQKACRTCSTKIFLHSTNQIIDL